MSSVAGRLAALSALLMMVNACSKHEGILAPSIKDPVVFDDEFGEGVDYRAFAGSKFDAVDQDTSAANRYDGTASLKVTVPPAGTPNQWGAGGTFATTRKRDLSVFNALSFWAKADHPITLDKAGLGIDATWGTTYEAWTLNLPIGVTWAKYVVPIPFPERLTDEGGLFYFAEGPENGLGSTIWLDDVMFEYLDTVTNPRPQIPTETRTPYVGVPFEVTGTQVTFAVSGVDRVVGCGPAYFTFLSDNEAVAKGGEGVVSIVGSGDAIITAKRGTLVANGAITVHAKAAPLSAPPRPTLPVANVISLLTMVYPNVTVDQWSTSWDFAEVSDVTIGGDNMKLYTITSYAAADFSGHLIDASAMTAFHMDVWVPSGNVFKVKLVDFGANGLFGGGDDSEHELMFTAGSTPALQPGQWTHLELPLSSFIGLVNRAHLAQLILSGDVGTAFVDNIYFHK
ncbi:MAG TPA: hypothetical protein VFQ05_18030 [Candidatus Eisenbacteria bacterium]|nr:hypothetical protein [Candidatus Eisenbacteria bacterium]